MNHITVIEPRQPMAFVRWLLSKQDLDFPPHLLEMAEREREAAEVAERKRRRDDFLEQERQAREIGKDAGLSARAEIRRFLQKRSLNRG